MAEEDDLKSFQCRFESDEGHKDWGKVGRNDEWDSPSQEESVEMLGLKDLDHLGVDDELADSSDDADTDTSDLQSQPKSWPGYENFEYDFRDIALIVLEEFPDRYGTRGNWNLRSGRDWDEAKDLTLLSRYMKLRNQYPSVEDQIDGAISHSRLMSLIQSLDAPAELIARLIYLLFCFRGIPVENNPCESYDAEGEVFDGKDREDLYKILKSGGSLSQASLELGRLPITLALEAIRIPDLFTDILER